MRDDFSLDQSGTVETMKKVRFYPVLNIVTVRFTNGLAVGYDTESEVIERQGFSPESLEG